MAAPPMSGWTEHMPVPITLPLLTGLTYGYCMQACTLTHRGDDRLLFSLKHRDYSGHDVPRHAQLMRYNVTTYYLMLELEFGDRHML